MEDKYCIITGKPYELDPSISYPEGLYERIGATYSPKWGVSPEIRKKMLEGCRVI